MRISRWKDYELIDTSSGERLERWGNVILIRPDPQIIWRTPKNNPLWKNANAIYHRASTGGGAWENLKKIPEIWTISYNGLLFNLKTMGFKHTGIFPEQAVNWDFIVSKIKSIERPLKVLNLFGYTGAATLFAAKAGATVCHVDASKGMVGWARENAIISSLAERPIRWIVDDCTKFVLREIRRGNKYDGIIMEPPSYGRGPDGEIWKFEDQIFSLLNLCAEILSDNAEFLILNSYTSGRSPAVMDCILRLTLVKKLKGYVQSDNIGLPVTDQGFVLPCGSTAIWQNTN